MGIDDTDEPTYVQATRNPGRVYEALALERRSKAQRAQDDDEHNRKDERCRYGTGSSPERL